MASNWTENAGGVPADSRRLRSTATIPPVTRSKIACTLEGGQNGPVVLRRRRPLFAPWSKGVTVSLPTPSHHITGLQPGKFPGLKATHVIAWAGASPTSAGPGSSIPTNLPSPVGAAHVPPNPSRISLTTSRPSPGLTGRRMGCFILFSWGVTSWGCTPSYHITGLQPGNFPGLKATHVIAWAGASSASAGPGGLGSSSPMNLPSPVGAAHGDPDPSQISSAGGFPLVRRVSRRPRPGGSYSYPTGMLRTEARA